MGHFIGDGRLYDYIFALLPVNRCSNLICVCQLQSINDTQDFIEVSSGGCRVGNNKPDLLIRGDDEYVSHGELP